jgi:hypothetical protein
MALTKEDLLAIKSMLDPRFDRIDERFDRLEDDVEDVKERLTKIEVVQLENHLIPKVEEIASYQKSVYERYTKDANCFEEKISLIDSISKTVEKHSEQIKELQLKQA